MPNVAPVHIRLSFMKDKVHPFTFHTIVESKLNGHVVHRAGDCWCEPMVQIKNVDGVRVRFYSHERPGR